MTQPIGFPKLLAPGQIGGMKTRNRIVMSPMATNFAAADGQVTDLLIDHYEQRARGGVGLVITEGTCIEYPRGKGWANEMSVDDDRFASGLKRLTDAIHKHGGKIALQLHHAGRGAAATTPAYSRSGLPPLPSPVARSRRK